MNGMITGRRIDCRLRMWLFAVAFTLLSGSVAAGDSVILIVNKGIKDAALTRSEIRLIFLGKCRLWENGTKIVPCYIRKDSVLDHFTRGVIGKTPSQFLMYWKRMVFTGKASMPKSFKTNKELIEYVRKRKGAIGFIESNADSKGVRVLGDLLVAGKR